MSVVTCTLLSSFLMLMQILMMQTFLMQTFLMQMFLMQIPILRPLLVGKKVTQVTWEPERRRA